MDNFDPAATLSPDDPLQQWLRDPAMAEFVKQKALEHATNVLQYSATPGESADPTAMRPTPATPEIPLDPVAPEAVPIPKPRPEEAGLAVTEGKKKVSDEAGDFGKTLAALKPLQPPAVNPVGTPSVRAPNSITAPNIQNLLQLFGAQARPDPVTTLGRLLVAGKA